MASIPEVPIYTGDDLPDIPADVSKPVKPLKKPAAAPAGNPYDALIKKHAAATGLDEDLISSMMGTESASDPTATSWTGKHFGLLQTSQDVVNRFVKPNEFGTMDPKNPEVSIAGGTRYMRWLLDRYKGDTTRALAGYNAGEGRADKPDWKNQMEYWSNDPKVQAGIKPRGATDKTSTANYTRKIGNNYAKTLPDIPEIDGLPDIPADIGASVAAPPVGASPGTTGGIQPSPTVAGGGVVKTPESFHQPVIDQPPADPKLLDLQKQLAAAPVGSAKAKAIAKQIEKMSQFAAAPQTVPKEWTDPAFDTPEVPAAVPSDAVPGQPKDISDRAEKISDSQKNEYTIAKDQSGVTKGYRYQRQIDGKPENFIVDGANIYEENPRKVKLQDGRELDRQDNGQYKDPDGDLYDAKQTPEGASLIPASPFAKQLKTKDGRTLIRQDDGDANSPTRRYVDSESGADYTYDGKTVTQPGKPAAVVSKRKRGVPVAGSPANAGEPVEAPQVTALTQEPASRVSAPWMPAEEQTADAQLKRRSDHFWSDGQQDIVPDVKFDGKRKASDVYREAMLNAYGPKWNDAFLAYESVTGKQPPLTPNTATLERIDNNPENYIDKKTGKFTGAVIGISPNVKRMVEAYEKNGEDGVRELVNNNVRWEMRDHAAAMAEEKKQRDLAQEHESEAQVKESLKNPTGWDQVEKIVGKTARFAISPFTTLYNDAKNLRAEIESGFGNDERIQRQLMDIRDENAGSATPFTDMLAQKKALDDMSGPEFASRFVMDVGRSFVKTAISDSLKGVDFLDSLNEKYNPAMIAIPDAVKPSLRNLGNGLAYAIAYAQDPARAKNLQFAKSSDGADKRLFFNIGKALDDALGEDPYLKNQTSGRFAQALGSSAGFLVMGLLAPEASIGSGMTEFGLSSAALGGLTQAGSGYEEAVNAGFKGSKADLYGAIQGVLGMTEGFGVGASVGRAIKTASLRQMFTRNLVDYIKSSGEGALKGGTEELIQEFVQSTGGRVAMDAMKDQDPSSWKRVKNIIERLPDQAAKTAVTEVPTAFMTGGLMEGATHTLGGLHQDGPRVDLKNNILEIEGKRYQYSPETRPAVEEWIKAQGEVDAAQKKIEDLRSRASKAKTFTEKKILIQKTYDLQNEISVSVGLEQRFLDKISTDLKEIKPEKKEKTKNTDLSIAPKTDETGSADTASTDTAPVTDSTKDISYDLLGRVDELSSNGHIKDSEVKPLLAAIDKDPTAAEATIAELEKKAGMSAVSTQTEDVSIKDENSNASEPTRINTMVAEPFAGSKVATEAAFDAATSPENDLAEPTQAQKEAGNYKKGHITINGLDISVENPVGSARTGIDRDGKPWSVEMAHHYGYIKRTVGADDEQIDVFVKDGVPADHDGPVFVVDQAHPDNGKFDEHKVLLGFDNEKEARAAYAANYAKDWKGLKDITEMSFEQFKSWVKDGTKDTPVAQDSEKLKTENGKAGWLERALAEPVTNIGQLSADDVRALDAAVKRGEIIKGKGGQFPAVKTVYAPLGFDIAAHREQSLNELTKANRKDGQKDIQNSEQATDTPQESPGDTTVEPTSESDSTVQTDAAAPNKNTDKASDQKAVSPERSADTADKLEDVSKKPHELTRDEYETAFPAEKDGQTITAADGESYELNEGVGGKWWVKNTKTEAVKPFGKRADMRDFLYGHATHHKAVSKAVREGETVSPEILATYPQLEKIVNKRRADNIFKFRADEEASKVFDEILRSGKAAEGMAEKIAGLDAIGKKYDVSPAEVTRLVNTADTGYRRRSAKGENVPAEGTRPPSGKQLAGKNTLIRIPGETTAYNARYAVREADDVHPSHNPFNFNPNPEYWYTNDRHYDKQKGYQASVVEDSMPNNFQPEQVVNNAPTAEMGPPVIDVDGNALGGNSRMMKILRVYAAENAKAKNAYIAKMKEEAAAFGLTSEDIAKFDKPVLVREITDTGVDKQSAITDFNKVSAKDLSASEAAIAGGTNISEDALSSIANAMDQVGSNASVTEMLNAQGPEVVQALIDDGVFNENQRNTLIQDGKITDSGKTKIRQLLLGKVFDDLEQMEFAPAAVRNNIERVILPLIKTHRDAAWDILPQVREAIDLLTEHAAKGGKESIETFVKQDSLVKPEGWAPEAVAIASTLRSEDAVRPFKVYAGEFRNAEVGSMFGTLTPKEAFTEAFSGKKLEPVTLRSVEGGQRVPANHFDQVVDKYFAGVLRRHTNQIMMDAPTILHRLGPTESRYVVISEDVLHKISESLHRITKENLKALPQEIARPVAVFTSANPKSKSLVFLTSLKDAASDPILVVIKPSLIYDNMLPGGKTETFTVDIVTSAYGKQKATTIDEWARTGLLRYVDKEKARRWLEGYGTNFPSLAQATRTSDNKNVLTAEDIVKKPEGPRNLRQIRTEEDADQLYRVLPSEHLADVLDQSTGGTFHEETGELELTPADADVARRLRGEVMTRRSGVEAEEPSFNGAIMDAATLREMATVGREKMEEMPGLGYPQELIDKLGVISENLDKLATRAKDYGILYVFDDALGEERFHQKDLRAGRTDEKAEEQIAKESLIYRQPGALFIGGYGGESRADKISEIIAKLATGQAEKYGWDKLPNFEEEVSKLRKIWADGVIRNNIDEHGHLNLGIIKFSEVINYAYNQAAQKAIGEPSEVGGQGSGSNDVGRESGGQESQGGDDTGDRSGGTQDQHKADGDGAVRDEQGSEEEPKVKTRKTVLSAEKYGVIEKGAITGDTRYYTVKSPDERTARAQNKIERLGLEKAVEEARQPIESLKDADEQATFQWETVHLLNEVAYKAEVNGDNALAAGYLAQKQQVLETLAMQGTPAGRLVQSYDNVRKDDYRTVTEYVEQRRKRFDYNDDLNTEQKTALKEAAIALALEHEKVLALQAQLDESNSRAASSARLNKGQKTLIKVLTESAQQAMQRLKAVDALRSTDVISLRSADITPAASLQGQILDDLSFVGARILFNGFNDEDVITPAEFEKEFNEETGGRYAANWEQVHAHSMEKLAGLRAEMRRQNAIERVKAANPEITDDAEIQAKIDEDVAANKEKAKIRGEHRKLANKVLKAEGHLNQRQRLSLIKEFEKGKQKEVEAELAAKKKTHDFVEMAARLAPNASDEVLAAAALIETDPSMGVNEAGFTLRKLFPDLKTAADADNATRAAKFDELNGILAQGRKLQTRVHQEQRQQAENAKGTPQETKDKLAAAKRARSEAQHSFDTLVSTLERPPLSRVQKAAQLQRMMMVSAINTAANNLVSGVATRGQFRVVDVFDTGLQKLSKKLGYELKDEGFTADTRWADVLGFTGGEEAGKKAYLQQLASAHSIILKGLDEHPDLYNELYGDYSSDISDVDAVKNEQTGLIHKALDLGMYGYDKLNFANRWQEYFVRDLEAMYILQVKLGQRGLNLTDLERNGELSKITADEWQAAIARARRVTFALKPERGTRADQVLRALNDHPVPSVLIAPFAKFSWNVWNMTRDWAPGIAQIRAGKRVLSEDEARLRDLFNPAKYTSREMANSISGFVFLAAALGLVRNLGDRDDWYYLRVPFTEGLGRSSGEFPNGSPLYIDMRQHPQFAPFLYLANKLNRVIEGRDMFNYDDPKAIAGELGEVFLSLSYRQAVDQNTIIQAIGNLASSLISADGAKDREKGWYLLRKFVGERVGIAFSPLRPLKNVLDSAIRSGDLDLDDSPAVQGFERNLPGVIFKGLGYETKKNAVTGGVKNYNPYAFLKPLALNIVDDQIAEPEMSQTLRTAKKLSFDGDYSPPVTAQEKRARDVKRDIYSEIETIRKQDTTGMNEGQKAERYKPVLDALDRAVAAGTLTQGQADNIKEATGKTRLEGAISGLKIPDALTVYKTALTDKKLTDADRESIRKIVEGKIGRAKTLTGADIQKAASLGFNAASQVTPKGKPADREFKDDRSFIGRIKTLAEAAGADPVDAFNKWYAGETIRRTDNGTIIVDRMDYKDSSAVKRERGATKDMILDHTRSLQLGGGNEESNLVLVPKAEWQRYTPVENALGRALRSGSIKGPVAQDLLDKFKRREIGEADINKAIGSSIPEPK